MLKCFRFFLGLLASFLDCAINSDVLQAIVVCINKSQKNSSKPLSLILKEFRLSVLRSYAPIDGKPEGVSPPPDNNNK